MRAPYSKHVWRCVTPPDGARDHIERADGAARLIGLGDARGALLEVRRGDDWQRLRSAVAIHSIRDAEIALDVAATVARARRAVRYSPRGWTLRERLGLDERRPSAPSSTRAERREWRYDEPEALELARAYLDRYPPAVAGDGGTPRLFGAAVAIVLGFKLLPDGLGAIALEEYNARCVPPFAARELRRALVNAENYGQLRIGALLPFGGRGAGKGAP